MPLQGLDEESKLGLLQKLVAKDITISQLQTMAKNIKAKKRVAESFMRYAWCRTCEELQLRFPKHATEEKLVQFSTLQLKGKEIPTVEFSELRVIPKITGI